MRLKTIKLAGFKSFVDPTTFHLPSHMIGVVGPNGCGKSNIIDAVRWVMGESSPRLLRGDSMADVIFNGSNSRKPVGAATVELIFDNVEGALKGEYASYSEISIRRTVSRDGHSQYFLNGTRCRRRDITDLFLGTGLGPRSYSIIEQGMISQLVESRPEELRGHLEEAAGISLYKERRRDTENRIRRTRENLERLDDLRSEVETQLRHLQRQARQAEKYKELKAQQRFSHAQLLAINWRAADSAWRSGASEVEAADTALQARIAELRAVETRLEEARQQQVAASEAVNAVQGELYEVGGRIARLEQAIAHRQELEQRQKTEHSEAVRGCEEMREHLALDQVQLTELETEIAALEPELAAAREAENSAMDAAEKAEQALSAWQEQWQALTADSSERNRAADIERTRIDHLDRQLADTASRLQALAEERQQSDTDALATQLQSIERETTELQREIAAGEEQLDSLRDDIESRDMEAHEARESLSGLREEIQASRVRLGSLEALQKAARTDDDEGAGRWVEAENLTDAPTLVQQIEVTKGWENATELVLGPLLQALVVDDLDRLGRSAATVESGRVQLVAAARGEAPEPGTLASKIQGPQVLQDLTRHIRAADSVDDLLAQRSGLKAGESIVSPDGTWAGRHWLRVLRGGDEEGGVLAREREIGELSNALEKLGRNEAQQQTILETAEQALAELETRRDQLAGELATQRQHRAELAGRADGIRARLKHLTERAERIAAEQEALQGRISSDEAQVREARGKLQGSVDHMAELEQQRTRLEARRTEVTTAHEAARKAANQARHQAHELALKLESRRSALDSIRRGLDRTRQQLQQLETRAAQLLETMQLSDEPMAQEETALKAELEVRQAVEGRLTEKRKAQEQANSLIAELDRQRHQAAEGQQQAHQLLDDRRVAQEGLRVRVEALAEQLAETELETEALLKDVAEDADPAVWAADLDRLSARISRLEPVNLAAISELEELNERKQYLDAQNDDLNQALETLEGAIKKIDRETRTRFKETYDKVNTGIQELFPKLFGGGHAYMELIGDDLLTAGVAIMARPPGKRITNIHLLSGGEKALTAVALVFSIFRLNPAPFCMLDEVDAPLDDANVGRFSDLVSSMSEQVQFLFVTHNKITMEVAHQLVGVTMHEPGVSRLVSVDVAEAARMAEA